MASKKKVELKEIHLEEFRYPCVEYCIRRLGRKETVTKLMARETTDYTDNTKLQVGDIIIWYNDAWENNDRRECTLRIGSHGPVSDYVNFGVHYAVYEGDGLVSDLVFDSEFYFPHIRITPLAGKTTPSKYLRLQ